MKSALLVIDVQPGLFDDEPQPFEADAVVERINGLVAQARAAAAPVLWIQHERAEGFLAHGSDSWQLHQRQAARDIRAHHNATLPGMVSFGPRVQALPAAQIVF